MTSPTVYVHFDEGEWAKVSKSSGPADFTMVSFGTVTIFMTPNQIKDLKEKL